MEPMKSTENDVKVVREYLMKDTQRTITEFYNLIGEKSKREYEELQYQFCQKIKEFNQYCQEIKELNQYCQEIKELILFYERSEKNLSDSKKVWQEILDELIQLIKEK